TRLRYALDQSAFVTLSIYNTVGREEVTLVQARRPAGWHELILDGSSLSGGGYYYRLRVGSLSMARKMVVMRP
ncbi:MAG: T9SS type A sorting domain-containing protein, partial [Rhodothermales bacterium]